MASKRQFALFPETEPAPPGTAETTPPRQPGHAQALVLQRLRRQHVTRIRKLSRQ